MTPSWILVTGPTKEPITVAEAKQQARISHSEDDGLLYRYIKTARETAEQTLNRGLFTQTWQLALPRFYEAMTLPMAAPLQSVTKVEYYDTAGGLQTLAPTYYTVDTVSRPGRLVRAPGQAWPPIQQDRLSACVLITYVVGWTAIADIPERIKQGIRLYVTYMDCDREGLEQYGEQAMKAAEACWADRVTWIPPSEYFYRQGQEAYWHVRGL